ncbi:UNVERIFIED_CONTAM: hypothetical protein GTU68_019779 [Idotea baltica]|nr:hypothetical protein [Idotea baltica]
MPGLEKALETEKCSAYLGTDPTADSLHVGNLSSLMLLIHFQKYGHTPIVLMGGATGMVGDPSGKSKERNLLSEADIQKNLDGQRKQMENLFDFNAKDNSALMVNNYDWYKEMNILEFLRDIGKHLTINYMSAKDSVKKRIESGLSFTEFSYQLIQGYDFYYLWKNYNCKVQLGGSDQWGNITSGTELIRKMGGGEAYALTCPLITKADGSKFGKSESGAVWLDAKKTSPYKFFQFWLNASDTDAEQYIKKFTLLGKEEIDTLIAEHNEVPHQRILQKRLAKEVTTFIHGEAAYEGAVKATQILFKEGVPTYTISKAKHGDALKAIDFLSEETGILPSKSEARRALQQNSISINMEKIPADYEITTKDFLNNEFILVQKGRKNKYLVIAE